MYVSTVAFPSGTLGDAGRDGVPDLRLIEVVLRAVDHPAARADPGLDVVLHGAPRARLLRALRQPPLIYSVNVSAGFVSLLWLVVFPFFLNVSARLYWSFVCCVRTSCP